MLRPLYIAVVLASLSGPALAKSDLLTIYQEALLNSADLAAAEADALARQEALPQARAQLLPNIGLGAGVARERVDVEGLGSDSYSTHYYQASLTQPLFRADRWFNYQASKSLSEQARVEFSATQQQLILDVALAYFNVLRASDNLATARAEEAAFERQLEQARERFEVGLSARTDVLEALAGFDTARAARITAATNLDVSYQALTRLTNRDHTDLLGMSHNLPILAPVPADMQEWVETAAAQNLGLQASRLAIDAAGDSLRSSKAGYAPTVDAFVRYNDSYGGARLGGVGAGIGGMGAGGDTELTQFGVEMTLPLFTGGGTTSRVRESNFRLTQAEHTSEAELRRIVERTRNLFRTVTSSVEEVEARRQSIISSKAAVDATQAGYEVGTRNVVDVLDAQRNLFRAVRDYNDARYNYIVDNLNLKQAAGTLSPQDLEDLSTWLKADYDPDRDFIPPFTPEEMQRMSIGNQPPQPMSEQQRRMRTSF
ncbi:channel protein TolC [Pseudomonas sp. G11-1]|uniref:Channel protein TolC n=1 Tax=Halopseudomonas bauzanensis TaxID=653930 RepID=A0A4V5NKN0_9GAMM|nr:MULTISPECIES: TolC family outer membrane protein [Halopseudomonas]MCO5786537.1 channel protein TolC [Pseudomonas sp. G11-1]MCO5789763.1 channel protein TolC [Pseudomonas sp. G11-2]TKA92317.1 channel protein TolC [Halopseudomonas bauzanensis]WGK62566.1 TolC family outer membrane protein [Halopseudomonas sp. SMJS2]